MNLNEVIDEIGILETNIHLKKYEKNNELMENISQNIPISFYSLSESEIFEISRKIINLQKQNIMFLSNEISVLEKLLNYKKYFYNLIVVLSGNLSKNQKDNIINNSPNSKIIKYINELEYPLIIKPRNSILIAFGYKNSGKCIITQNSYRTLEIYKDFLGDKVFINCSKEEIKTRPKNWISINYEKYFTREI